MYLGYFFNYLLSSIVFFFQNGIKTILDFGKNLIYLCYFDLVNNLFFIFHSVCNVDLSATSSTCQ